VSAVKKPLPLFPIIVGAMLALFGLVVAIAYVLNLSEQVRRQPSVSDELELQCTVNGDTWIPEAGACIRSPQQGLTEYDRQKIIGGCSLPRASTPASPSQSGSNYFCLTFPSAPRCAAPQYQPPPAGEDWNSPRYLPGAPAPSQGYQSPLDRYRPVDRYNPVDRYLSPGG
jgi:hypothetical protein